MGSERDQRDGLVEDSGATPGSATRLRVALPSKAGDSYPSLAAAYLCAAGHDRSLQLVARRLVREPRTFETRWLEHCARCAELGQEDSDYVLMIQRSASPLLGSLSAGRLDQAELHARELFSDLRELSFGAGSVLRVIGAFEQATVQLAGGWSGGGVGGGYS
jgi:hypothetical protein